MKIHRRKGVYRVCDTFYCGVCNQKIYDVQYTEKDKYIAQKIPFRFNESAQAIQHRFDGAARDMISDLVFLFSLGTPSGKSAAAFFRSLLIVITGSFFADTEFFLLLSYSTLHSAVCPDGVVTSDLCFL